MPKAQAYSCTECGAAHSKWSGRCDACGAWNSIVEEAPLAAGPASKTLGALKERAKSLKLQDKSRAYNTELLYALGLDYRLDELTLNAGQHPVPKYQVAGNAPLTGNVGVFCQSRHLADSERLGLCVREARVARPPRGGLEFPMIRSGEIRRQTRRYWIIWPKS